MIKDNRLETTHSADRRCESTIDTSKESIMPNIEIIDNNQPAVNSTPVQPEIKLSQAEQILGLTAELEFFHTPDGEAYASVPVGNYFENYRVDSKEFKRYLSHQFYRSTGIGLKVSALNEILPTLEAKSLIEGSEFKLYVRTAFVNGKIYLDICDKDRKCVEISPTGWRIIDNPPVKFNRTKHMTPLPIPQEYGDVVKLRKHINLTCDHYYMLIAWILSAMKGTTPLPILVIMAEQGSGKSTATKLIRALFDPSDIPLRSAYQNTRDLMVTCVNNYCVTMDNISNISDEMSDMLCGIATGTGQVHRGLYTNREEDVLQGRNPIMINGIDGLPPRADFIDRAVLISPIPILEAKRIPEATLLSNFEADKGKIFGGLCDALSSALFKLPDVMLAEYPRMADFASLAVAASQELGWDEGWFTDAYTANQLDLTHRTIDSCVFIDMLDYYLQNHDNFFMGTVSALMKAMKEYLTSLSLRTGPTVIGTETNQHVHSHDWPKSPQHAGQLISRFEPSLRKLGYKVTHTRSTKAKRSRLVAISKDK